MLCNVAAELETETVPVVLQLAKSEMLDEFRSEAAGVSIHLLVNKLSILIYFHGVILYHVW